MRLLIEMTSKNTQQPKVESARAPVPSRIAPLAQTLHIHRRPQPPTLPSTGYRDRAEAVGREY